MVPKEGAPFTSEMTMITVLASLYGGEPLSVTRMVRVLVAGPWASEGVHVNTPLPLMLAPAGGESIEYVSVCGGRSESVVTSVKLRRFPSTTLLFSIGLRVGAELASITTTVIDLASLMG